MPPHLHFIVTVQESSKKIMHYIVWPHSVTSTVKKAFVKTYTDKGPPISLKHNATASRQQGSTMHQLCVFTSSTRTSSTATRAISSTPLNMSCSRGGKQHTLCACINRIKHVREQSFPKKIYNNKLVLPLAYFIHQVSTS